MPSFIADGYAFKVGIDPIEGVHDGLEIEYRAMTPIDSAKYVHEIEHANGEELRKIQAGWLIAKVQRWQLMKSKDGTRDKIPQLNEEILTGSKGNHIHPMLLSQLIDVVIWGNKPDAVYDSLDEESVKN